MEHKRQLRSLQKRIKEIKNWQQRKKDHSDPIAYPIYLIRDEDNIKDSRIDVYCKKVLGCSTNKKKKVQRNHKKSKQLTESDEANEGEIRKNPAKELSPKPFYSSSNSPQTLKNRSELIQPTFLKSYRSPYQKYHNKKKPIKRRSIHEP